MQRGGIGGVIGDQLDGELIHRGGLAAGCGMDFVIVQIGTLPLDMRRRGGHRLDARDCIGIAIKQESVLGNVSDNLRARPKQGFAPLGQDGTGELDEVQALAGKAADGFAQGLGFRLGTVQGAGVEENGVVMVARLDLLGGEIGEVGGGVVKLKPAIIGDQMSARGHNASGQGGVADLEFVARAGGRRGGNPREKSKSQPKRNQPGELEASSSIHVLESVSHSASNMLA